VAGNLVKERMTGRTPKTPAPFERGVADGLGVRISGALVD